MTIKSEKYHEYYRKCSNNFAADSESAISLDQSVIPTSLAYAYVKSKVITLPEIEFKHQITQLNIDRKTVTIITRLRMKYHKHIKISANGTKVYQKCGNCIDVKLTSHHAFNFPVAAMHCLDHPSDDALYFDLAISIAETVLKHHDIWTQLFCSLSHLSDFFFSASWGCDSNNNNILHWNQ